MKYQSGVRFLGHTAACGPDACHENCTWTAPVEPGRRDAQGECGEATPYDLGWKEGYRRGTEKLAAAKRGADEAERRSKNTAIVSAGFQEREYDAVQRLARIEKAAEAAIEETLTYTKHEIFAGDWACVPSEKLNALRAELGKKP